MITFLCELDFAETAKCLDYRRLGKQRVEAKQILEINLLLTAPKIYQCEGCGKLTLNMEEKRSCGCCNGWIYYSYTPEQYKYLDIKWMNHPAVLMWRGFEYWLSIYGQNMCAEWINRGYRDNLLEFFVKVYKSFDIHEIQSSPKWMQDEIELYKVIQSHRSNLLRKDYNYYSKLNWNDVEPNLPYYWPVKKDK